MSLPGIYDQSFESLASFLCEVKEPPFRAKQNLRNPYTAPEEDPRRMTNPPAA
jgi:adenine C2-methylase RlmN of 23S rRNA A2503 and tRNA A37